MVQLSLLLGSFLIFPYADLTWKILVWQGQQLKLCGLLFPEKLFSKALVPFSMISMTVSQGPSTLFSQYFTKMVVSESLNTFKSPSSLLLHEKKNETLTSNRHI
jgi:hypothetical protein